MVVAIATWSLVVSPGKKVTQEVYRDFKITNAALGAKLEDEKARSTLKVSYEPPPLSDLDSDEEESPKKTSLKKVKKSEIALCSLTPGTVRLWLIRP
jgi:FK506-binding nuclear protein